MKLCWLIPSDRAGGVTPVALSCCRQASEAGYETTLLALLSPTWMTGANFQVSCLGLPSGAPETPKALLQWLEANPQDVLFFNGCEEFDPAIPYLSSQIKCVYVVHDTAPTYWRKVLAQEDNLEAIVAVSETVARQFRHRLKRREKLFVIHNGCVFPNNTLSDRCQDNLLFLGGENPTKGAYDVLKVWQQLIQLEFAGELHWFGCVSPEFRTKIERMPAAERIYVYGHVDRDLIFATAASAKVLLMLSRVEPFGMATIEAMSMGCVPVAWDIDTGTKEIVTTQTGFFAPLGDTQILAEQAIYACKFYSELRAAVIERARSHFNETVMWSGYQFLLDRIAVLPPIHRHKIGQQPLAFQPPVRRFQLLPPHLRHRIRESIGQSPRLGYWLRDLRGW